jgi:soluble lytic murein transglycosylase
MKPLFVAMFLFFLAGCGQEPAPTAPARAPALPVPTWTPVLVPDGQGTQAGAPQAGAPQAGAPQAGQTGLVLPTPTPEPAQLPAGGGAILPTEDLLEQGRLLVRYGDYAGARALLTQVAADPGRRAEALYDLGRAYLGEGLYGEALATLEQLDGLLAAEQRDPGQFGQKEQFLRGEALLGLARYSEAVAAYGRFLESYPWMNETVQPRIARAYRALNDSESAAAALRRAADESTDRVARVGLLEELAQLYVEQGRSATAAAVYAEILDVAVNPGYRTQILYKAGQALAAGGDNVGAVERWRAATAEDPTHFSAYLALVELVNRSVEVDLSLRGYIDLQAEAWQPAIAAYQGYLERVDPSDARAGQALHELGQAYLGAADYGQALATFDQLLARYPGCPCSGQAWLDKAAAQQQQGDGAGARRTYRTFARDAASDPLAPEARWLSGRSALAEGNSVEAAVDFLALADSFPAHERAPQALYLLGFGAFSAGRYGQAAEVLARLQSSYPDPRWEAAAYWLGRAQLAVGQPEAARATWQALVDRAPDLYYGILARYALAGVAMRGGAMFDAIQTVVGPASRVVGDDGSRAFAEAWLAGWLGKAASQVGQLPVSVADDLDLAKGRLLLELDQRGDALAMLERTYQRWREDVAALYPLSLEFARIGAYRLSILSAARLLQFSPAGLVENAPVFLQQLAYPRPFAPLIEREAQANGLDPFVYYSLIRQESLFEEGARSSAAAQGLAQIIPDTGHWIAARLGHPEYTNDIIYRPAVNLRFGAYYLAWAREYLEGNLVSALAGYNAGPGNAESWRARFGAEDTLFVEQMTYAEPRLYIQLVLSNVYHYTRLYGG